ncbi:hypothetical protein EMIHUDRAFT_112677 [Emiliania huxleyi CCMP1516]|uniref:Zeta toxin domain-containing protein n=2 Tax=Emiliania huxleyi TaxID=2903 RepID=A0A0D3K7I8_EMIH1|nr:hypothetical protein EMIHUDRAFT_112677 [Emiliania huxleyi CCMP1516]EOD31723.1 hypothetical protein EMIHUDRAFT_112677 [Emiliania huxleyi CCMP1516]|eukprot:XP_005784152.1 hypothetical protein EMIHUDRAFT_112677 [Emiliania huxleyi CCMP1516]
MASALPLVRRREAHAAFALSTDFDYTACTCDAYRDASAGACQRGKYAKIRESLDHAYHGVYTAERQALQDRLAPPIDASRTRPALPQAHPWLLYTAGAMGAGKSHTVRWMWEAGHFPLEAIVHLDPDLFKTAMPEWDGYVALDPMSAGQRTQRESGYLVEIAQAAAMAERRRVSAGGRREDTSMGASATRPGHVRRHIWVDGSLRDLNWRDHPAYRLAILHVTASEEQIFARASDDSPRILSYCDSDRCHVGSEACYDSGWSDSAWHQISCRFESDRVLGVDVEPAAALVVAEHGELDLAVGGR